MEEKNNRALASGILWMALTYLSLGFAVLFVFAILFPFSFPSFVSILETFNLFIPFAPLSIDIAVLVVCVVLFFSAGEVLAHKSQKKIFHSVLFTFVTLFLLRNVDLSWQHLGISGIYHYMVSDSEYNFDLWLILRLLDFVLFAACVYAGMTFKAIFRTRLKKVMDIAGISIWIIASVCAVLTCLSCFVLHREIYRGPLIVSIPTITFAFIRIFMIIKQVTIQIAPFKVCFGQSIKSPAT